MAKLRFDNIKNVGEFDNAGEVLGSKFKPNNVLTASNLNLYFKGTTLISTAICNALQDHNVDNTEVNITDDTTVDALGTFFKNSIKSLIDFNISQTTENAIDTSFGAGSIRFNTSKTASTGDLLISVTNNHDKTYTETKTINVYTHPKNGQIPNATRATITDILNGAFNVVENIDFDDLGHIKQIHINTINFNQKAYTWSKPQTFTQGAIFNGGIDVNSKVDLHATGTGNNKNFTIDLIGSELMLQNTYTSENYNTTNTHLKLLSTINTDNPITIFDIDAFNKKITLDTDIDLILNPNESKHITFGYGADITLSRGSDSADNNDIILNRVDNLKLPVGTLTIGYDDVIFTANDKSIFNRPINFNNSTDFNNTAEFNKDAYFNQAVEFNCPTTFNDTTEFNQDVTLNPNYQIKQTRNGVTSHVAFITSSSNIAGGHDIISYVISSEQGDQATVNTTSGEINANGIPTISINYNYAESGAVEDSSTTVNLMSGYVYYLTVYKDPRYESMNVSQYFKIKDHDPARLLILNVHNNGIEVYSPTEYYGFVTNKLEFEHMPFFHVFAIKAIA